MALNEIMHSTGTRVYSGGGYSDRLNGNNGHGRVEESREILLTPMERIRALTTRRSPYSASEGATDVRAWGAGNPSKDYLYDAYSLSPNIASIVNPEVWIRGYTAVGLVQMVRFGTARMPIKDALMVVPNNQPRFLEMQVWTTDPHGDSNKLSRLISVFRAERKWRIPSGSTTIQIHPYFEAVQAIMSNPLSNPAVELVAWKGAFKHAGRVDISQTLINEVLKAVERGDKTLKEQFLRRLVDYYALLKAEYLVATGQSSEVVLTRAQYPTLFDDRGMSTDTTQIIRI